MSDKRLSPERLDQLKIRVFDAQFIHGGEWGKPEDFSADFHLLLDSHAALEAELSTALARVAELESVIRGKTFDSTRPLDQTDVDWMNARIIEARREGAREELFWLRYHVSGQSFQVLGHENLVVDAVGLVAMLDARSQAAPDAGESKP